VAAVRESRKAVRMARRENQLIGKASSRKVYLKIFNLPAQVLYIFPVAGGLLL